MSSSGVHVSKGSQSATFVRSKRHSDASRGSLFINGDGCILSSFGWFLFAGAGNGAIEAAMQD